MKTRIKIVPCSNGITEYYPQYKWLCFWLDITSHDGQCYYYLSRDSAEDMIDRFLTTRPIEYVEYPSDQS